MAGKAGNRKLFSPADQAVRPMMEVVRGAVFNVLQLWAENAVFQRIMYKNKNQHRRCLYFRRLTQVQRDLNRLQSFGLNQIVESSSLYLVSPEAATADGGSSELGLAYTFTKQQQKRVRAMLLTLHGAARLLDKMVEPILKASRNIAGLLQSSFFMPFALTTFSCLARLRVLINQVMYDVVILSNLLAVKYHDDMCKKREKSTLFTPSLLECSLRGDCWLLSGERILPPPVENSVEVGQEPQSPAHPIIQWVVDDRSGKIIDLKRKTVSVVESPCPPEPLANSEPLSEGPERTDPFRVRGEDGTAGLTALTDDATPAELAMAVPGEDGGTNGQLTPVASPPCPETNLGTEPEDKREPGLASPARKTKRKGCETEERGREKWEPEKRVAYLAVKSSPAALTLSGQSTPPLPSAETGQAGTPAIDGSELKSQRKRTDDIFEMLLGGIGKTSLF